VEDATEKEETGHDGLKVEDKQSMGHVTQREGVLPEAARRRDS
jgi:hypothetical protein